jgi:hypothetical protein
MTRSAEKPRLVYRQRFHDEPRVIDSETDFGDCHVDLAQQNASNKGGPVIYRHVHADSWMRSTKPTNRRADGNIRRVRTGADPQEPDVETEHLLQVFLDVTRVIDQLSRLFDQSLSNHGRLNARPIAIEKLCPN